MTERPARRVVNIPVDAELLERVGEARLQRLHAAILHHLRMLSGGGHVSIDLSAKTGGTVNDSQIGSRTHLG